MTNRKNHHIAWVYIRNIYTSLAASLASWILSSIMLGGYRSSYEYNEITLMSYASQVFLTLLFPAVVVFTAWLIYNYFDNLDLFNKREYFENEHKASLISKPQYVIGFAIAMLFSTLIFTDAYEMMLGFFFPGLNIAVARLLAIATMAILRLVQLWSLRDKWQTEIENPLFVEKPLFKRNRDIYTFKAHQLFWQPAGYFIVMLCAALFTTEYGFSLFLSVFNLITSPELWWLTFTIPIIFIAIIITCNLIYNTRKRAILLKKLKQMERERLATVKIKGRKYLSATFIRHPLEVEITDADGERYNCLVISGGAINAPIFFKPDEYLVEHGFHLRGGALLARGGSFMYAVDVSKLGGKENPTNMAFGFRTSHKLSFPEAEGCHKVVILNPTPTTAFAVYEREYTSIDTGERIGNYTVYTASGLFNHIERQSRKSRRDYDY